MYTREKFFTFNMDPSRSLSENLDIFKKIVYKLKKLGDDNGAYMLLNPLLESYKRSKKMH